MSKDIPSLCDRLIEFSFYLLLFLTPLILTPFNYELFEYNKMMLTYALTTVTIGAWAVKMVVNKRFSCQRTPLDLPIVLFLASQVLSFIFSIDRHVSFWGYYSRAHGGLASTISYLLLYYAFVSNLDKEKVIRGLKIGLISGAIVAAYGVAEHFGIDAQYWVQDVKNRVFSTLGQPNWLAAYLSILLPLAIALGLKNLLTPMASPEKNHESGLTPRLCPRGIKNYECRRLFIPSLFMILASLFYLTLLYTKSRSGFLGFWAGNLMFWSLLLFHFRKKLIRWFLILNCSFLIINFFVGSPFEQINRFATLSSLREKLTNTAPAPGLAEPGPAPQGGTESGEIRRIVWKGAIEIFKHYPVFGSGVETFAFSYYQFRPPEHNLTSEWDFLYNKAHNEYLNFLATTGAFGLGSYLLLIGWYLFVTFKYLIFNIYDLKSKNKNNKSSIIDNKYFLLLAFLSAYISILISNFFGFSVVVVALFFFLIPAFTFIINGELNAQEIQASYIDKHSSVAKTKITATPPLTTWQKIALGIISLSIFYFLITLGRLWLADVFFARGYNMERLESYPESYEALKVAADFNPQEPLYHDELSSVAASLALEAVKAQEATRAVELARESLAENQKALLTSPRNVNFWKTRTKVLYSLSFLNEEYNKEALEAIKTAHELAPTDARISYNLAILFGKVEDKNMAIKTLQDTIALKPDYRDARYALALYLKGEGKTEEAIGQLEYILENISPQDEESQKLLDELKGKK